MLACPRANDVGYNKGWQTGASVARFVFFLHRSVPMALPAVLYFLQNMLYYVALQRVRSATFSVLIQVKLLTTALFSVLFLGRKLHGFQWRALLLLSVGVLLVQTRSLDGIDNLHSEYQQKSAAQGSTAQSAPTRAS